MILQTRPLALTVILSASLAFGAHAASPEGSFQVTGTNPDGEGSYTGTVTVEPTGETFRVSWEVGDALMQGTGIAHFGAGETALAVTFGAGESHGIALMTSNSDGSWFGTWTIDGGEVQGIETWETAGN